MKLMFSGVDDFHARSLEIGAVAGNDCVQAATCESDLGHFRNDVGIELVHSGPIRWAGAVRQFRNVQLHVLDSLWRPEHLSQGFLFSREFPIVLNREQHMGGPTAVGDEHRAAGGRHFGPAGCVIEFRTGDGLRCHSIAAVVFVKKF